MNTAYLQTIASDYNDFLARCRRGVLFMIGGGIVLGFLLYKLAEHTITTFIDIYNDYLIEYFQIVWILLQEARLVFLEEVVFIAHGYPTQSQIAEAVMNKMDKEIDKVLDEVDSKMVQYYRSDEFRAKAQQLVVEFGEEELREMANGESWDDDDVVYAYKNYETLSADHYGDGLLSLPCKYVGSSTLTPYILGERL